MTLVLLDHRDSFTFNLAQALGTLGARVEVRPARTTRLATLRGLRPERIVLGPGPGRPESAELALGVIEAFAESVPILGVCLGFQVLAVAHGGRVERAPAPLHGRTVKVSHDGLGVFRGLPGPLRFTRYNSLAVDPERIPTCFHVSARAEDGDVMGLRHVALPMEGVQFHPESVLSEHGMELLANFLKG